MTSTVTYHATAGAHLDLIDARRHLAAHLSAVVTDIDDKHAEECDGSAVGSEELEDAVMLLDEHADDLPDEFVAKLGAALAAASDALDGDRPCPAIEVEPAIVYRYAVDLLDALADDSYMTVRAT